MIGVNDLNYQPSGERRLTLKTLVLFITSVQLGVPVPGPFMLEQPGTV